MSQSSEERTIICPACKGENDVAVWYSYHNTDGEPHLLALGVPLASGVEDVEIARPVICWRCDNTIPGPTLTAVEDAFTPTDNRD